MELFRELTLTGSGRSGISSASRWFSASRAYFSMLFWHHINLGVDFNGGTLVYVQFDQTPNIDKIRQAVKRAGIHDAASRPTAPERPGHHFAGAERDQRKNLDRPRATIVAALSQNYSAAGAAAARASLISTTQASGRSYRSADAERSRASGSSRASPLHPAGRRHRELPRPAARRPVPQHRSAQLGRRRSSRHRTQTGCVSLRLQRFQC